jgi:methionine-rich copper-binding protein CopC
MPAPALIAMVASTTGMKRRLSVLLTLASALGFGPLAAAHAFLDHAIPGAGSAVHRSPAQLSLWFSERLDPPFSKAEVLDVSGKRVDAGDPQVDSADPKLLWISLPPLAPGRYRVAWRVQSIDTHVSKGEFTFDIVR